MPGTPGATLRKCGCGPCAFLPVLALELEGAMVGRQHLEEAIGEAVPQEVGIAPVARRRRAQILGAFPAGLGDMVLAEKQILRAGLAVDPEAAVAAPLDLLQRLARRHMHEQDRHIDDLGQRDRAVRRLALHRHRRHLRILRERVVAGGAQLLCQPVDAVIILGMDHDHGARAAGGRQHLQDLQIVERQALIGHVDLEASCSRPRRAPASSCPSTWSLVSVMMRWKA